MPSRSVVLFVLGMSGVVLLHEVNTTLGTFAFVAVVGILLIGFANRTVGPVSTAAESIPAVRSEKVELHLLHGGELYKVSLEVIITMEIGAFHDTVVSPMFWQGVFRFADHYPSTIQALNEAVGDYTLAALRVLNNTISLRYPKAECKVGTVSVELMHSPTNVSVG